MMKESIDEIDKISHSSKRPLIIKTRESRIERHIHSKLDETQMTSKNSHDVNSNNTSISETKTNSKEQSSKENSENREIIQLINLKTTKESEQIEPVVEMSEERKELERKKQRVYERLKAQEEQSSKENMVESNTKTEFSYSHHIKRHSEVISNSNEKPYKSPKIMNIAKQLEQRIYTSECESFKLDLKSEVDEYTKILMEKPIQVKKGRKFTKTDFSSTIMRLQDL